MYLACYPWHGLNQSSAHKYFLSVSSVSTEWEFTSQMNYPSVNHWPLFYYSKLKQWDKCTEQSYKIHWGLWWPPQLPSVTFTLRFLRAGLTLRRQGTDLFFRYLGIDLASVPPSYLPPLLCKVPLFNVEYVFQCDDEDENDSVDTHCTDQAWQPYFALWSRKCSTVSISIYDLHVYNIFHTRDECPHFAIKSLADKV